MTRSNRPNAGIDRVELDSVCGGLSREEAYRFIADQAYEYKRCTASGSHSQPYGTTGWTAEARQRASSIYQACQNRLGDAITNKLGVRLDD